MIRKCSIGMLVVSLLALSFNAGQLVFADREQELEKNIPYDKLRLFTEVFARIKTSYVVEVEDDQLLEDAIRGMLAGLDPHSAYLDEQEYSDLQENTSGEFGGLGIEVTMEDGFIKVVSPIDDTPAQRAGVQAGDVIIRLDELPVKGMSLNEAVRKMRGKPGTPIELTIVREGADGPFKLEIKRDVVRVRSVRGELLEPGYAYIRISAFQVKTSKDLLKRLSALKVENKSDLKGLILDLRNNPGGVLSAAVDVADAFLDGGLIVYTKGRTDAAQLKYNASPGDFLEGVPLVVLVNGGSASASEIVAGAIQDHVRGIVMGSATFGKGSVQTILPLDQALGLKLTTARYYTPKGRSIQAEGIKPDIKLSRARVEILDKEVAALRESNLSGHLDNGEDDEGDEEDLTISQKRSATKKADSEDSSDTLASRDYQLFEALNLLKGLNILSADNKAD